MVALANMAGNHEKIEKAVKKNPHWLVKLAGYSTGVIKDFTGEVAKEDNFLGLAAIQWLDIDMEGRGSAL